MFASPAVTVVFTVVFLMISCYSLLRLALLAAAVGPEGDQLAELSHLLMGLAMIAMTLGWTGGPGSASGIVQLLLFGLLTLWFLGRAVGRSAGHGGTSNVYHLVMTASMVWMVAAMPRLMGMPETGSADAMASMHGGHDGGSAAGAAHATAMAHAPTWMVAVNWGFVALLGAGAALWARRAARARPNDPGAAVPSELDDPVASSSRSATAVATRPTTSSPLVRLASPRTDAVCHLLMSLGMAVMLVAAL